MVPCQRVSQLVLLDLQGVSGGGQSDNQAWELQKMPPWGWTQTARSPLYSHSSLIPKAPPASPSLEKSRPADLTSKPHQGLAPAVTASRSRKGMGWPQGISRLKSWAFPEDLLGTGRRPGYAVPAAGTPALQHGYALSCQPASSGTHWGLSAVPVPGQVKGLGKSTAIKPQSQNSCI